MYGFCTASILMHAFNRKNPLAVHSSQRVYHFFISSYIRYCQFLCCMELFFFFCCWVECVIFIEALWFSITFHSKGFRLKAIGIIVAEKDDFWDWISAIHTISINYRTYLGKRHLYVSTPNLPLLTSCDNTKPLSSIFPNHQIGRDASSTRLWISETRRGVIWT